MELQKFKISILFPFMYIFSFIAFIAITVVEQLPSTIFFFALFALGFISFLCTLYVIYFIAKALKSIELQRSARFDEFVGEFFLIWFFPIGIWIIQPTVNKLFDK